MDWPFARASRFRSMPNSNGWKSLAHDQITDVVAAEVEAGGAERTIVIPHILERDGKPGTIVGLLGEVDAGWKLFPLHTVKLITPSKRKIE